MFPHYLSFLSQLFYHFIKFLLKLQLSDDGDKWRIMLKNKQKGFC